MIVANGREIRCGAVVLTTGTFLRGVIHIGEKTDPGRPRRRGAGRSGCRTASTASGLRLGRLKTGTPPRLDGTHHRLGRAGDAARRRPARALLLPDRADHHAADRLPHHPHHGGDARDHPREPRIARRCTPAQIESIGPRYCPSIEDKVVRFAERDSHQIFLEPEGLDDDTVYPNGISTSLPEDVQLRFLRDHPGPRAGADACGRATPSNTTMSIRAS